MCLAFSHRSEIENIMKKQFGMSVLGAVLLLAAVSALFLLERLFGLIEAQGVSMVDCVAVLCVVGGVGAFVMARRQTKRTTTASLDVRLRPSRRAR